MYACKWMRQSCAYSPSGQVSQEPILPIATILAHLYSTILKLLEQFVLAFFMKSFSNVLGGKSKITKWIFPRNRQPFFFCCFKILEDKRSNHLPRTVTWGVGGITWRWRVNPIILHLCPDSDRNGFPPKETVFFFLSSIASPSWVSTNKPNLRFHH